MKLNLVQNMKLKLISILALAGLLSAGMSTSSQLGPDASTWSDYLSWYKVTLQAETGDPTGFLGNVHDGRNAFRQIYVNSLGAGVNQGTQGLPYPEGTILVKESFNNETALEARRSPDLTLMVDLASG